MKATPPTARAHDARERVSRHVRRTVGLKVLRDLQDWAQGVQREQRERPRLVSRLLLLVFAVALTAGAGVWLWRGGF